MNRSARLRRVNAIVVTICLVFGFFYGISFTNKEVLADDAGNSLGKSEEYIYYSDLFYGYSDYLVKYNEWLMNYSSEYIQTRNAVISEYIDTPEFYATAWIYSVDIAKSPESLAKYVFDKMGVTSSQYNEDIDAVNIEFLKAINAVDKDRFSASDSLKADNKHVKYMKKALDLVKNVDKAIIENYERTGKLPKDELYTNTMDLVFEQLLENSTKLNAKVPEMKRVLYAELSEITDLAGGVTDVMDFANSFIIAYYMQEAQLDMVQDIINVVDKDSVLYKGMTRLKNQLITGSVSYFTDNYICDKVYEKISGAIKDAGIDLMDDLTNYDISLYYKIASLTCDIVNGIIKKVLGVDYQDYSTSVLMGAYADELYSYLEKKSEVFGSQFKYNDIKNYEKIFDAYVAVTNCSMGKIEKLAKYNKDYGNDFVLDAKKLVCGEELYSKYVEATKNSIKNIPIDRRKIKKYDEWVIKDISDSRTIVLSGGSDEIVENCLYFTSGFFNGNIVVEDCRCTIDINEGMYNIKGNFSSYVPVTIKNGSDVLIDGNFIISSKSKGGFFKNQGSLCADNISIAALGNLLSYQGDINVENDGDIRANELTIKGGSGFFGDERVNFNNNGTISIQNISINDIAGNLNNYGKIVATGLFKLLNQATVNNYGTLHLNDYYMKDESPYLASHTAIINSIDDAKFLCTGNFHAEGYCTTENGRGFNIDSIVLCGEKQQEISNLCAKNIDVQNKSGIKYLGDCRLKGEYKLNGNPLDCNGFVMHIYDGCSFEDCTDYGDLKLSDDVHFDTNVKANIIGNTSNKKNGLYIAKDKSITVDGNITDCYLKNEGNLLITGEFKNWYGFENLGKLEVNGNVNLTGNVNFGDLAILRVGGDYTSNVEVKNGTVEFIGSENQFVRGLKTNTIILNNTSDSVVYFLDTVNSKVLFNHNRNNFSLYNNGNGSWFADYDGDGLKDNEDPYPLVKATDSSIDVELKLRKIIEKDALNWESIELSMNDSGKINGNVEIKSHSCPKRFVDDLRLIPKIEVSYPAGKYVEKLENLTYSSNADCNVFLNLENNIKIGDKLQLKLGFDVLDSNGNTLFYEVCNSELVVDSIPYYCKNEYVIDNDKETPTPSVEPSTTPSEKPSVAPSSKPSEKPSESFAPSSGPSTQPTGEIIIGNHSWYSLLEDISFDTYKSNDETITIKSNNATDKIEYFIKDTDVLETKALTVDALSKCEFKQYDKDNKPVISGKRNIVVYAKITSKNGEISYLCSDGFIFNNLKDALQWKHIDLKPGGDMHVELDSRELPKDIERDSIATLKILVCNEEGRIISTAGTDVGANTVINMLVYSPEFKEGFNGKLRIGYDIIKKDGTRYFYEIFTYDLSIKDENMNISNVNYMPKQEPSPEPSSTPSVEPSETATPTPSVEPSAEPDESETPSVEPGESVKPSPSPSPSVKPSTEPDESETPSVEPGESVKPSSSPSPSARPSEQPSEIPSISPSEFPNEDIVKGDVNGDNQVTLTDAQIVLKVALGITSLTDESVADVNGDKQVTLIDAQLVLKAALGIIKL